MDEGAFQGARRYWDWTRKAEGLRVGESHAERPRPFGERHLQCVWYDPCWRPSNLRTTRGEEVTVESPGRWNVEPGPDFLDAVLWVGAERRRVQGDVEVHPRAGDWNRHGHAGDSRYRGVAVHVFYEAGRIPARGLPGTAVEICLGDALRSWSGFSFDAIDVTAYPYASFPRADAPCAGILGRWSRAQQEAFLEAAGQERLRCKAERLMARIESDGEDQALYEGLMEALGYKHNRIPCAQLARRVRWAALREEAQGSLEKAYAVLLGVAGLLPSTPASTADPDARAFFRTLWDLWWKLRGRWEDVALPRLVWCRTGLRPANRPERRLAAAAAWATVDPPLRMQLMPPQTEVPVTWARRAGAVLEQGADFPYWRRRLTLTGRQHATPLSLVGRSRAASIVTNVLVPFWACRGLDVSRCLSALPPEEDNVLVRHGVHTFFGRDHNPRLSASGLRQQGVLQVFHDFCLGDRSGCRECRLIRSLSASSARAPV